MPNLCDTCLKAVPQGSKPKQCSAPCATGCFSIPNLLIPSDGSIKPCEGSATIKLREHTCCYDDCICGDDTVAFQVISARNINVTSISKDGLSVNTIGLINSINNSFEIIYKASCGKYSAIACIRGVFRNPCTNVSCPDGQVCDPCTETCVPGDLDDSVYDDGPATGGNLDLSVIN